MRPTLYWDGAALKMIDQTRLPHVLEEVRYTRADNVADAITTMVVRGAPAIGATAACGLAMAAAELADAPDMDAFLSGFHRMCDRFAATRPTAVNLFWAIDRMRRIANSCTTPSEAISRLRAESEAVLTEDVEINRRLGEYGQELLPDNARVLTHCNAGALACVGFGTALGVFRAAVEAGKSLHVYADETRPRLQGMQLTAWEMVQEGIPVTVISDGMAATLMRSQRIDAVVVGADRIAANGDTANKVGTYHLSIAARYHDVPVYIAAPLSTIDRSLATGAEIPIEERDDREVTHIGNQRIAPEGIEVWNPSFDVTPAELISGIITEAGVLRPPYESSIAQAFARLHGMNSTGE